MMKKKFASIASIGLLLVIANTAISGRVWGDHGIVVATNMSTVQPAICLLGEFGLAAAFPCFDENGVYRAAIQGVEPDGSLMFEEGHLLISSPDTWLYTFNTLVAISDNDGGVYVIWQSLSELEDHYNVYAQHFDENLTPQWENGGINLYRANTYFQSSSSRNYCGVSISDDNGLIIVERREVEQGERGYSCLFYVRKYDEDGSVANNWPEEGELLFEMVGDIQFYREPGRGLWCFARDQEYDAHLQVNLIQPDGTEYYEEPLEPVLPDGSDIDSFAPDNTGGFYLGVYERVGNGSRIGVQRYNEEGNTYWDDQSIWFGWRQISYAKMIPIASENGNRLFCFLYNEEDEELPLNSYIYWFDPREDDLIPLWNRPMFFEFSWVEPFFFMGEGDLLLNIMNYDWDQDAERWSMDQAEANFISPNGFLVWDENTVPIEIHGQAVLIDWESFFVTTETVTEDRTNELRVDYMFQFGESEWEEETQVYSFPQFGEMVANQQLPDGTVRLLSGHWMNHTSHEQLLHYQLLNPDGTLRLPIQGQAFIELIDNEESISSNGAYIVTRYEGGPGSEVYSDVSVFDDNNIIHPEEPLAIQDLNPEGEYKKAYGDSAGGCFLIYRNGSEDNWYADIIHLDRDCEWDGQIIRPFDRLISTDPVIIPDGSGGAWITVWVSAGYYLFQKISADNELAWDEARRWDNTRLRFSPPIWLAMSDSSLAVFHYKRRDDPDSSNVKMWCFDSEGVPKWDGNAKVFEPCTGFEHPYLDYDAISSSTGGAWLAAWESFNAPPEDAGIRIQLMSPDGERLWGDRGLALPNIGRIPGWGKKTPPRLLDDLEGGVWVITQVYEAEPEGLRAFHFNRNGEIINDQERPNPHGTPVIRQVAEGMRTGYVYPTWRYENGDIGVAFWYGYTFRAQRLSDRMTGVSEGEPTESHRFEIVNVYPSPSNDWVTVSYRLHETMNIDLTLLDITGRQVGVFYSGIQSVGEHRVTMSTNSLASGVYIIQLEGLGSRELKVMVELK